MAEIHNYYVDPELDAEIGIELSKFNLNYVKEPEDPRDKKFHKLLSTPIDESALPVKVDLRDKWGSVFDQGNLGSCVSNSVAGCIRYVRKKDGRTVYDPSRLYIYYYGRVIEDTVNEDSGLYIRDGFKSVKDYSVCSETNWPYKPENFTTEPSEYAKKAAKSHRTFTYLSLDLDKVQIKKALSDGYPISFGLTLYPSFMSSTVAKTGRVPVPDYHKEKPIGGHCMTVVGYDDESQYFTIVNSWSDKWGNKGFCYIPYEYFLNPDQCSDLWTARSFN